MKLGLAGLAAVALLAAAAAHARAAETRRYAVIVANARSLDPKVAPLEYADDDGARYAELFDGIADRVNLLTVLDARSQAIYPTQTARAIAPDRQHLLDTLQAVFAAMRADRSAGRDVVFYFVMVGHGDIGPGGEGYVSLLDQPFTRTDLFEQVIAPSPARPTNHVIVDACNSYFLVNRRGGGEPDDGAEPKTSAVNAYLGTLDLARYPNTGVLLSTATAKESHEWSAISAGVFSHELRSALAGGADANGDGRIDYSEIHAFVAAANLRVEDVRARVEMFIQPPAIDRTRPLVDLTAARFPHHLGIPAGKPFRFYLEDDRGVRFADVNTSGERALTLALVPRAFYYIRTPDRRRERRLELGRPGRIDVSAGSLAAAAVAARGSVSDSFQQELFAEAFGPGFYRGFAAANGYASPAAGPAWLPAAVGDPTGQRAEVEPEAARARGPRLGRCPGPGRARGRAQGHHRAPAGR